MGRRSGSRWLAGRGPGNEVWWVMVERVDMHRTAFLRYMPTGTRVDKAELFGGAGTTVAFTLPDGREGEHTITPELYVMRGLDVVGPAVRQFMRDAGLPIQVPRR